MKGTDRKVIFQGVHQLMGSDLGPKWAPGEKKTSKMVFIGIDLPQRHPRAGAGSSAWSERRGLTGAGAAGSDRNRDTDTGASPRAAA